jgi:hypothetical protein
MRRNKNYRKAATDDSKISVPASVSVPTSVSEPMAQRGTTPVSVPPDPPSPKGKKPVTKAAASQKASAGKPVQEARPQTKGKDRRVQRRRSQNQCKPEDKQRAELEACDQGAVQGKRIRVLQVATLPKPES